PTRYGGIDASTEAFKSRHVHAVSVKRAKREPDQAGGHQSAGQPDQADGRIAGGDPQPGSGGPSTTTPEGSPGTADGGPAVAGGTSAGSFGFGVMSGGRIERENSPTPREYGRRLRQAPTPPEQGPPGGGPLRWNVWRSFARRA